MSERAGGSGGMAGVSATDGGLEGHRQCHFLQLVAELRSCLSVCIHTKTILKRRKGLS